MSKWIAFEGINRPKDHEEIWVCDKGLPNIKGTDGRPNPKPVLPGKYSAFSQRTYTKFYNEYRFYTHWQPRIIPTHIDLEENELH